MFSFGCGWFMGRVGKIVLVRTGVRGDPIELRLMVWFDFSVLFFYFFLQRRIRKRSYQQELFIGEGGFYGGIGRLLPESVPLRLPWSSWAVVLLGGCREDFLS